MKTLECTLNIIKLLALVLGELYGHLLVRQGTKFGSLSQSCLMSPGSVIFPNSMYEYNRGSRVSIVLSVFFGKKNGRLVL